MSVVDIVVLAILAGSILLGLTRGLVKEMFSLAAWVAAFIGARLLGPGVAQMLPGVADPALRHALSLLLVFVAILVGAGLAGSALAGVVRWVGLGGYDRFLGMLFGALRAGVALVALALLAGMTALPQTHAWQSALSRAPLESSALWFKPWLPRDVARLVKYS